MSIAGHAVGSYPTFSPLPSLAVYFLWHSLYAPGLGTRIKAIALIRETGSRRAPDVIRHRALMSPDFPRRFLSITPRQHGSLHIHKPRSGRKVTGSYDRVIVRSLDHSSESPWNSSLTKALFLPPPFLGVGNSLSCSSLFCWSSSSSSSASSSPSSE